MYRTRQVACGVFIGLTHVNQHSGVANGVFGLGNGDFVGMGFGLGHQVVSGFHRLCLSVGWISGV